MSVTTTPHELASRLARLLAVILGAFLLVGVALAFWGVARSDELLARPDNPRPVEAELRVRRGRILDAADRVLADMQGEPDRLQRVYPLASAGPAVGYYSLRHGTDGIEQSFDAYLRGEPATDWQRYWQETLHIAPGGRDIRLSLDATLQDAATSALAGQRGAVVVLEAGGDGEPAAIRALASQPGYDPNQLDEQFDALTGDTASPLFDRAAQGLYQPGLIVQPLIVSAALDRGAISVNDTVRGPDNAVTVDGRVLRCREEPPTDARWADVLALSCPAPVAALGDALGPRELDDIFSSFGLTQRPELPIATASGTDALPGDAAQAAIGQDNLTVTPLQVARAYAALAGDGSPPWLQLVSALQDSDGDWQPYAVPQGVSPSAAGAEARDAVLEALSQDGGAVEFTATALAGPAGDENVWYVGLTPEGEPRYVVAVVLENPNEPERAAEIGRQVLAMTGQRP